MSNEQPAPVQARSVRQPAGPQGGHPAGAGRHARRHRARRGRLPRGFYEEAQPAATAAPVIPAAQFDDGQARFFTYDASSGETVRFFVMKSGDGVIRAHSRYVWCPGGQPAGRRGLSC
jgi:hypothetical protein